MGLGLLVVGTVHQLRQSQAPHETLLLGDDAPGHGGAGGLHDGLAEEVPRQRRQEVQTDAAGSSRLSHQGDVVGVTTELGDVVLHPLHGHQLVEHAGIARDVLRVEVEEAEGGDPVLDAHGWNENVKLKCFSSAQCTPSLGLMRGEV